MITNVVYGTIEFTDVAPTVTTFSHKSRFVATGGQSNSDVIDQIDHFDQGVGGGLFFVHFKNSIRKWVKNRKGKLVVRTVNMVNIKKKIEIDTTATTTDHTLTKLTDTSTIPSFQLTKLTKFITFFALFEKDNHHLLGVLLLQHRDAYPQSLFLTGNLTESIGLSEWPESHIADRQRGEMN